MASDGKIIIETSLDTKGFEKDVETATGKVADGLGKGTEKAMKQAENSIKNVGKAVNSIDFSKVSKQMDSISKDIEKTSTRLDKQKEKLNSLKKAYENATNVESKNKISSDMQKAETSITKLENKLNSLKDKKIDLKIKMDSINDLDSEFHSASVKITDDIGKIEKKSEEAGNKIKKNLNPDIKKNSLSSMAEDIEKTGKSISDVGNTLSTHVTLPVVALSAAAAKVGMDFDSGMSRVKAISGATGEEFTKLHDQALQLGADTAFSAKQAAEGMENLASAGFNTNEIMSAMPGMLDLAASSGETIATSSDIAASALRGFGLQASDAGHVADVLAVNASKTNAQVADTGEALKYVATNAHTAGWSLEETVAAIGDLSNYGIKGTQAGTTLREMLVRLASPSKEAAEDMKKIGFNAFDSQGKMKSLSTIVGEYSKALQGKTDQQKQDYTATIFGQEAMSGLLALVQGGSSALDDLTNSYKASDGAAKDMAKTMQDNAGSSIEQMMGSIETAAIKLEEVAAPSITKIAGEIEDAANRFSQLSPEMQETIIKTALLAATAGPVLKILGTATSGIGSLITFGGRLAATFGLLGEGASIGGTALTAFSTAGIAAAGVAGALAVGVAGAITYNELLSKSVATSTDDLNAWEKVVNICTGGVIKSKEELQKAGLVYKDFGDGVSKSFKTGIEAATKQYHDFEMALTGANMSDTMSTDNQSRITNSINKMIDGAKNAINSRKGEIQNQLTDLFTADGSGIDENEQKVLDISTKGADEKLAKISEIQGKISEVWTKAIAQHGKLSNEDIQTIKNYIVEVQQIEAEAKAENDAESSFAKNNYAERLNGISAEDASKEYTEAEKTVKDNFINLKARYQTGIKDLNDMRKKAQDDFDKAQTDDEKKKAQDDITTIQNEIEKKTKAYEDATGKEQSQIREYLNMLYEKNPTLKNNMNEVTGEIFSDADKNAQGRKEALRSQFSELADVTKTGIQHIQDANGKWHDIYVTFDEATGNITGTYDTLTGKYGGYSAKFEDEVKTTGSKIKAEMEELQKSLMFNGGGVKLDSDNNAINATTDQLITKLDTVVKKADGAKTAIQDINGVKVRLEFDKDGTLTNAQDVEDAINGKFKDNPAVVKTKIKIDNNEVSTIDETEKKLANLPEDKKVDITINGDEAIMTAKEAHEKLESIPKDEDVDINVNTEDADSKINTTTQKADELGNEQPNVEVTADTQQADNNLDATKEKADEVGQENPEVNVTANADGAQSILDKIISGLQWIAEHASIGITATGVSQSNYTGTNYLRTGLSAVNEHGYETAKNSNVKMLSNGLAFLIGHHYTGGDGINDHMTTVNEMHNDITNQVGESVGKVVSTLISSLSGQGTLLKQVVANTSKTVTVGEKGNQLNEKLATDMVNNWKSNSNGSFTSLAKEIDDANNSKSLADNAKVENKSYYMSAKQNLDSIEAEIDQLKDKMDNTTDESVKKELEAEQKVLEKKKDVAEQEVNVAKEAAQNEIEAAKNAADEQVKIAEAKKEKLTQFTEAVTTALKNEYTQQKSDAENSINAELTAMETAYNKKVAKIEDSTKSKSDSIDKQIKELEHESTDTGREDEKKSAKDNIFMLTTKRNNTASIADKRSLDLQIKKAQEELNKKEESWNIEDDKAELEEEKTKLSERAEKQKKSLEEEYNRKKKAKEKELKDTDKYYDKLLEEDSINAQARYRILNNSQADLVKLLNSYNSNWQDAGQSLADSLLSGLNSKKQSVEDAVTEMMAARGSAPVIGSDKNHSATTGYASGTPYNAVEGYYLTNEDGPEMSTNGDVAYVSKGAAIKNRMQTDQFIKSEIASKVAMMKASVMAEQANMKDLLVGNLARSTSNRIVKNEHNQNAPLFHAENVYFKDENDIEQMSYKLGFYATRNKVN